MQEQSDSLSYQKPLKDPQRKLNPIKFGGPQALSPGSVSNFKLGTYTFSS